MHLLFVFLVGQLWAPSSFATDGNVRALEHRFEAEYPEFCEALVDPEAAIRLAGGLEREGQFEKAYQVLLKSFLSYVRQRLEPHPDVRQALVDWRARYKGQWTYRAGAIPGPVTSWNDGDGGGIPERLMYRLDPVLLEGGGEGVVHRIDRYLMDPSDYSVSRDKSITSHNAHFAMQPLEPPEWTWEDFFAYDLSGRSPVLIRNFRDRVENMNLYRVPFRDLILMRGRSGKLEVIDRAGNDRTQWLAPELRNRKFFYAHVTPTGRTLFVREKGGNYEVWDLERMQLIVPRLANSPGFGLSSLSVVNDSDEIFTPELDPKVFFNRQGIEIFNAGPASPYRVAVPSTLGGRVLLLPHARGRQVRPLIFRADGTSFELESSICENRPGYVNASWSIADRYLILFDGLGGQIEIFEASSGRRLAEVKVPGEFRGVYQSPDETYFAFFHWDQGKDSEEDEGSVVAKKGAVEIRDYQGNLMQSISRTRTYPIIEFPADGNRMLLGDSLDRPSPTDEIRWVPAK